MGKSNSSILGIFYILFQTQFNGFVKCFIDGDEDVNYYSVSDFLDLAKQLKNQNVVASISEALTESSFFLWDVDGENVRRLSSTTTQKESPMQILSKIKDTPKEIIEDNFIRFNGGRISIKK